MTEALYNVRPQPGPSVLVAVMAVALALDQASKWLIVMVVMQPPRVIPVFPGANLTLGFNEGASFGFLGGLMAGRPLLMSALTGALVLVLAITAVRASHSMERIGLALIVGSALGNIVDRLRQGAVTDFIDLYWRDWHWPTFNVADIGIALGVLCALSSALPSRRRKETALDRS